MKYGLIGEHLKHSFSKEIHESLMDESYELCELKRDEIPSFFAKKDFQGINVTIPYKEVVIPYLDEIDESAKKIGAVNTIINRGGRLIGYNTDYFGFIALINHLGLDIKDKKCLVLGNGGASKAVVTALNDLKAKKVYIASINNEPNTISYDEIKNLEDIKILVNATPIGMFPNNEGLIINLDLLPDVEGVIDVIYNPINTKLILEAKKRHLKAEAGLYMLISQGIKANELFLNRKIAETKIDEIYQRILRKNSNIVLMGMPSSGKSTIGKILSDKLNMPLIDIDYLVEKKLNMPIKEYFLSHSEDEFREIETEAIKDVYQNSGYIISLGGGAIKKEINIDYLKQNGIIYFINRDLEKLTPTDDRPLSNNILDLQKLYKERLPLYQKYMDVEIDNNGELNLTIERIIKHYENINN